MEQYSTLYANIQVMLVVAFAFAGVVLSFKLRKDAQQ